MAYAPLANSTYLDFTGYRVTSETSVEAAYGVTGTAPTFGFNVALVLERNSDPMGLLSENWATRQKTLADLNASGTLWTTYGADQALYDGVVAQLQGASYNLAVLDGTNSNYVSSAESRTIWVEINSAADFANLFQNNTLTMAAIADPSPVNTFLYWTGSLSLPEEWNVAGLWFDTESLPNPSNMTPGQSATLPQGPQSIGNGSLNLAHLPPQQIAALYNFPLDGQAVATGTIGLIEPVTGSVLPNDPLGTGFEASLEAYLASIGRTGTGSVFVQGADGQNAAEGGAGERSLDVGVVAAVNPNSNIALYNGSGFTAATGNAQGTTFTAIQSAIWDMTANPAVLSSSFGDVNSMSPGSPFYSAYQQLFVDAALRNKTFFNALGDGGSGNLIGTGLTELFYNDISPYNVMVGGSSLTSFASAPTDPSLVNAVLAPALKGDLGTLWMLVAGGLKSLPADAASLQVFVETVWNAYYVDGTDITINPGQPFEGGYLVNTTSSGGVDVTQPAPFYQTQYGLYPVATDPLAQPGRGAPDVTADAGGNTVYVVPNDAMDRLSLSGGTSAAAPLWASLAIQFNAIFHDQGLPDLGFANDLLYIASAVAPGSFNDVALGNNISSFTLGGLYESNGTALTPTGYGYEAGPGYDLVSGLGSPNGVLLGRALTAIAHAQMSFDSSPAMLEADGNGWESGADQTLLFQTMTGSSATIGLGLGGSAQIFGSTASALYAWTNRVAQQSLQDDFDSGLVKLFDKQAQGAVMQASISAGDDLTVAINASMATAIQGVLSSPFGFADFVTGAGAVRVARPVAVAETAGGADDQTAVVRLRQNGEDSLSLSVFRVDDLSGTVDGLAPGAAGYAAAAAGRVYAASNGMTSLDGPGYGGYGEYVLTNVDAGDMIAFRLTDRTSGNVFWGFAQANEKVNGQPVGHLWNYGLNTWGFEDQVGGGDHDFNDLILQFDFTSTSGSGWLM
ncbi:hypothetical protein [Reyranella soli]|nr:hypothetical protein [Reyranella soli]